MLSNRLADHMLPFGRGFLLAREDGAYRHWGIYYGDWWVNEFGGKQSGRATIRYVTLDQFAQGRPVSFFPPTLPPHEVLRRAWSLLGHSGYDLFEKNCEHFANWAARGEWRSPQAERLRESLVVVGAIALVSMLVSAA